MWRQASLPDVEGGIPAARKKTYERSTSFKITATVVFRRFVPPGWKPGSTAGKDACRYNAQRRRGIWLDNRNGWKYGRVVNNVCQRRTTSFKAFTLIEL